MNKNFNRATWLIRIVILLAALGGVFITMGKLKELQPPPQEGKVSPVLNPPSESEKPPTQ